MAQEPISDQTARLLRETWFRYLDTIQPNRAALHRYCRRLTHDTWDAEDLLQDTLLRGFGAIGRGDLTGDGEPVTNSRAYLFRIATNLWIDQMRRAQTVRETDAIEPSPQPEQALATREAVSVLLTHAAPQARAAVILKDAFDFTLEEIAQMLSTTVGAIKSALHRGRDSLDRRRAVKSSGFRAPSKELLDRLVRAFTARDVQGVTALLLENVTLEVPGVGGAGGKPRVWVQSSMDMPTPNNPNPERREITNEVVQYHGQWIMVAWQGPRSDSILAGVNRFEEEGGRIARIWEYHFCPETIAEVAAELGATPAQHDYHQGPEILSGMIGSAVLPWTSS